MLADILPTGYEVGVLNGTSGPVSGRGRWRRPDRVVRDHGHAPLQPVTGCDRHGRTAGWRPPRASAPTRLDPTRLGPRRSSRSCRRPRSRLAMEAVGVAGTFESRRTGSSMRSRGQPRRPRRAGDPAPGGPLDPRRDDHDRTGRHLLHPDAVAAVDHRPAERQRVHHAPSRHERLREGLRRLRFGGPNRSAQGGPQPLVERHYGTFDPAPPAPLC